LVEEGDVGSSGSVLLPDRLHGGELSPVILLDNIVDAEHVAGLADLTAEVNLPEIVFTAGAGDCVGPSVVDGAECVNLVEGHLESFLKERAFCLYLFREDAALVLVGQVLGGSTGNC
jgi:hypothetical protein